MSTFKGKATNKGGAGDQCPAGNWPGFMLGLIDLGLHYDSYQGGPVRKIRRLFLVFEVEVEVEGKGDKRFWLGKDYNVGLDDKGEIVLGGKSKLRDLLEGWRGSRYGEQEAIDLAAIWKKPCLVNVIHESVKDKTYARVDSLGKLPRGVKPIKPGKDSILYEASSDDDAPGSGDDEKSEWLPRIYGRTIKEVLEDSLEWEGTGWPKGKQPAGVTGEPVTPRGNGIPEGRDEIPF